MYNLTYFNKYFWNTITAQGVLLSWHRKKQKETFKTIFAQNVKQEKKKCLPPTRRKNTYFNSMDALTSSAAATAALITARPTPGKTHIILITPTNNTGLINFQKVL